MPVTRKEFDDYRLAMAIRWENIKLIRVHYETNQEVIVALNKSQLALVGKLQRALDEIQKLAEEFDAKNIGGM